MNEPPILSVETITRLAPGGVEFHLSEPRAGQKDDVFAIQFAGWLVGAEGEQLETVECVLGLETLRILPLNHRPDVAAHLVAANRLAPERTGFHGAVSVVGLPNPFTIRLAGVRADASRIPLADVTATHRSIRPRRRPVMQPLMLLALGRSGTTWSMKLLSRHPLVVVEGAYPYETRAAQYWAHSVRALSQPPLPARQSAEAFGQDPLAVRAFPFARPGGTQYQYAFGENGVGLLATHAVTSIDEFYAFAADRAGKPAPRYFAEKTLAGGLVPGILEEMYGQARSILLVRDPRDVVVSNFAFNAQRGYGAVNRERFSSDFEHVDFLANRFALMVERARSSSSTLIVRYEDLVNEPAQFIESILLHCGLDASPATIASMISQAQSADDNVASHRTSSSPAASIGRWRTELSRALREHCEARFAPFLEDFGYA